MRMRHIFTRRIAGYFYTVLSSQARCVFLCLMSAKSKLMLKRNLLFWTMFLPFIFCFVLFPLPLFIIPLFTTDISLFLLTQLLYITIIFMLYLYISNYLSPISPLLIKYTFYFFLRSFLFSLYTESAPINSPSSALYLL